MDTNSKQLEAGLRAVLTALGNQLLELKAESDSLRMDNLVLSTEKESLLAQLDVLIDLSTQQHAALEEATHQLYVKDIENQALHATLRGYRGTLHGGYTP